MTLSEARRLLKRAGWKFVCVNQGPTAWEAVAKRDRDTWFSSWAKTRSAALANLVAAVTQRGK
jgi:hypothetical protein